MTAATALETVVHWFSLTKVAGLQLPDQWFGGEGRNLHRLTRAEAWGNNLILELDNQLLLIITEPDAMVITNEELVIGRFSLAVFDWQEFANMRPHAQVYDSGDIRFAAQPSV